MIAEEKLLTAQGVIAEALVATLGDAAAAKAKEVIDKLKIIGGTSDDVLSELKSEDLEGMGLGVLLARRVAKIFNHGVDVGGTRIVVTTDDPIALAARLKPAELVGEYDPESPENPVGTRLKEISNGKKFLVFSPDGRTLNVQKSAENLLSLLDHYPERSLVSVNGEVVKVYVVGDRPMRYGDEHPLYDGLLYRDGYSSANIYWGGVPHTVRQLLRIASSDLKEIVFPDNKVTVQAERDVFRAVHGLDFAKASELYPQAAVRFRELAGGEKLPSLKKELKAPAK